MSPELILLLFLIFVLAGAIKGLVGMGLPLTALGLMTFFIEPRQAIALVMLPMVTSNAWQVWRMGEISAAMGRYRYYIGALAVVVAVAVVAFAGAPDRAVLGGLGAILLLYVAISLRGFDVTLPDRWDKVAQIAAGTASGLTGGLTSVWAPPMALYLSARKASKDEFVRASGLLIFMGSLPLVVGYIALGFMTASNAAIGLALLVPTFTGFRIGELLRRRMSETSFRKALLVVFALIGLNLLRRAVF